MHAIGICHYVMAALVPELAVRLIKEDMKVCDESARQILPESRRFGDPSRSNTWHASQCPTPQLARYTWG
jgi:hypothetical protein